MVAVCSRPDEPIDGKIRYKWMKEICTRFDNVEVVRIRRDLPQSSVSSRSISRVWADYISRRFGRFDAVFSSEKYGDYLAEYMNTVHFPFDMDRTMYPVSGAEIRDNPYKNWEFLPGLVRAYYAIRVCIYGPESTGKTTLARQLAEHYQTVWVPEFARGYIDEKGGQFTYGDIVKIARGQASLEDKLARQANRILFCDTDAITTTIYSRHYFGKCPEKVKTIADNKRYHLYLFTRIDIGWESDPQRDLGHRREEFETVFREELNVRGISFVEITGKGDTRLDNAVSAIEAYLLKSGVDFG